MKPDKRFEFAAHVAKGLAGQFGRNCEVVIHDLRGDDHEHTIIAIENGHVTGRSIGDGPSHIVLESLRENPDLIEDRISYLTKTSDGRVLKSTTLFIRDDDEKVIDLLDELLDHSVKLVGKPTALMSKDEKIRAIRFLDERGAFLITKSGPKVCQFFGISTYTLYSYLDEIRSSAG